MTKINLLPIYIQKSKDVRRVKVIAAAVLAVVFFTVCMFIGIFAVMEKNIRAEIDNIGGYIHYFTFRNIQDGDLHRRSVYISNDGFLTGKTLQRAAETPDGAVLNALRFNFGKIGITVSVFDILLIQSHLYALNRYFHDVQLIRLTSSASGIYTYEIVMFCAGY